MVVVHHLAQGGQFRQQPALDEGRHHVIDHGRHAAPARDQALPHDVDVVDVEIGQVPQQSVRSVGGAQSHRLAVEPLQRAVRADVNDGVGAKAAAVLRLAQPEVGGRVLVVRRQVVGVVELGQILAPTPRRLRQQGDVAEANDGHHELPLGAADARSGSHDFRRFRRPPVRHHLRPEFRSDRVQPAAVHVHADTDGIAAVEHPVELSRRVAPHVPGAVEHLLQQHIGGKVDLAAAQVIALLPQALQDVRQRFGDVEVAGADVGLAGRIVVVQQRQPLPGVRRRGQGRVAQRTAHGHRHPGGDRLASDDREPGVRIGDLLLAADHGGRHQAREFRRDDLERPLEQGQTHLRLAPLLLAAAVEGDQAEHRNVEFRQRRTRVGAREPEQEGHRDVDPRFAAVVEQEGLERETGRIAEHGHRLGALPLDLGDHGVDQAGVPRVEVGAVEAHRDPRRARPLPAGAGSPVVELLPGREDPAAGLARVVVPRLQVRLRFAGRQTLDAGGREDVLEQFELVGETGVLPVRAGPSVPGHAERLVVVAPQEPLADPEDGSAPHRLADQVDAVGRVEALDRVLVVHAQHERVRVDEGPGIDLVEQRFGEQGEFHPAAQVGVLGQKVLPRRRDRGQVGVGGEVREVNVRQSLLRRQGNGEDDKADQNAGASPAHRRSDRPPDGRRCRGAPRPRPASRPSARRPRSPCRA